jgi:hypothetical protein
MLNGNSDGLTAKTVVSGKLYINEEAEYLKSSGPFWKCDDIARISCLNVKDYKSIKFRFEWTSFEDVVWYRRKLRPERCHQWMETSVRWGRDECGGLEDDNIVEDGKSAQESD